MEADLSAAAGGTVSVRLQLLDAQETLIQQTHQTVPSNVVMLDSLNVVASSYTPDSALLRLADNDNNDAIEVTEVLASNLFRSNCPVTAQPDWGTIIISYSGAAIDHESLLRYVISYRQHEGFHEHCVEQVYRDIMLMCNPDCLTVQINFLRRGGLEINPLRTSSPQVSMQPLARLLRQ
jgi:7-cyano-7-deazaguanine reductase